MEPLRFCHQENGKVIVFRARGVLRSKYSNGFRLSRLSCLVDTSLSKDEPSKLHNMIVRLVETPFEFPSETHRAPKKRALLKRRNLIFKRLTLIVIGQALEPLVPVSLGHYCPYTSGLSTSSSIRGLTRLTLWEISS